MSWRTLLSILALLTAAAVTGAGADDYVTLTLVDPAPTPYSTVRYEVSRRGKATVVVHRRQLPGYGEPLHEMGLLTPEEADALWGLVVELKSCVLPAAPEPPLVAGGKAGKKKKSVTLLAGPSWELDLSIDGRHNSFVVADAANQPDRRYAALIRGVRASIHRITGELPFRNVFIDSDAMGYLNVVSVPVARVEIDGFDTKLETPMYGYEMSSGAHRVRLVSTDGRFDRTYEVKVEAGGTTRLRVDIR